MAEAQDSQVKIYHEKQRLQMCAIHAINNLFQDGNIMNKEEMNNICRNLAPDAWNNPHKSLLGLGNYDINAIMAAMSIMGYEIVWFDKRRSLDEINFEEVFGMLVNTVSELGIFNYKIPMRFFKHWYAIRKINGQYYNLDSKLKNPKVIGSEDALKVYLAKELDDDKGQLLLVVEKHVADERKWDKNA